MVGWSVKARITVIDRIHAGFMVRFLVLVRAEERLASLILRTTEQEFKVNLIHEIFSQILLSSLRAQNTQPPIKTHPLFKVDQWIVFRKHLLAEDLRH